MNFKFPDSYKANRPKPFQWLGKILIKLSGWKIKGQISDLYENKKFVAIVAPHTSNWDAVVGLAAIAAVDLKVYFIGKHTVFKGILGKFMKYMGGIPVDRSKPGGIIKDALEQIKNIDGSLIAMSPEGTRSKVVEWKTGFLRIANDLKCKIIPASLDFSKKEILLGKAFTPSGNNEKDIADLKKYYSEFVPKHPERY